MKAKAIEIRWHNTKPIYSTDFQLRSPSNLSSLIQNKSHPYLLSEFDKQVKQSESELGCGKVWRLATSGGDNLVMIWLVYPRPTINQVNQHRNLYQSSGQPTPPTIDLKSILAHNQPPIVEYLATLTKHQGVVNVVRFCPNAEMLASGGDDGNVLLWVLSTNPSQAAFGESAVDKSYERESWRTRLMLRGPAQCEIYDLAWSPCGGFLLTGDTAKTARIWNVTDGCCIKQIAEHSNFVQGVAWDPLGEYITTQSSDRSMNIYSVRIHRDPSGAASADVQRVAKNYKVDLLSQQTNTWSNFPVFHEYDESNTSSARSLATSDTSAATSVTSHQTARQKLPSRAIPSTTNFIDSPSLRTSPQITSNDQILSIPPTPSSVTSSNFIQSCSLQPPAEISHQSSTTSMSTNNNIHAFSRSRQSSVVSSQAMSPSSIRHIRSPSPVPPLPAIQVNDEKRSSSVLLYGDEGASAFFRRLTWSNDGSMLVTPAGRWENRFNEPDLECKKNNGGGEGKRTERRPRRSHLGDKMKQTVQDSPNGPITLTTDSEDEQDQTSGRAKENPTVFIYGRGTIQSSNGKAQVCQPIARLPGHKSSSVAIRFSPVIYRKKNIKPFNLVGSKKNNGHPIHPVQIKLGQGTPMQEIDLNKTSISSYQHQHESHVSKTSHIGVFDLPYRMIYAVATHDTVLIYDTQQSSPICLFNNLHFSSFTDLSWTSDGETLILSSSDGYCSLVVFEQNELGEKLNEEEIQEFLPEKIQAMMLMQTSKKEKLTTMTTTTTTMEETSNDNKIMQKQGSDLSNPNKKAHQAVVFGNSNSRKRDVDGSNITSTPELKNPQDAGYFPSTNAPTPHNLDTLTDSCAPPPQKKKKRVNLTYEGPVQG